MLGRMRAQADAWKLALFTGYHAGRFAQADFAKTPSFERLIAPKRRLSNAEIAARFKAMAASSKTRT
jgi:hypothetical protein